MTHTSKNTWSVDVHCDTTTYSVVEMKAMLAARWGVGANTKVNIQGLKNNSIVQFYPWFYSTAGAYSVAIKNLYSPQLDNVRSLVIYTPPSYNENTLKTIQHMLIMQDGQNLFNPSTSFGGTAWMCQDTVNEQVVTGAMEEILIVGVYNTADRIDEYTYSVDPEYGGGKGDIYLNFVQQTVIPWVMSAGYRVKNTPDSTGIMGSSLGALISCYAGWTRPTVYKKAGCMSSSFWWNNQDFNNGVLVNYTYSSPQETAIYLDSGGYPATDGDDYNETVAVRDHIEKLGYTINKNLFYYWQPGAQHNEAAWGSRFYIPMDYMYPITLMQPGSVSFEKPWYAEE